MYTAALSLNDDWNFLNAQQDEFLLNLSHATLIECIDEYSKEKGLLHPSIVSTLRNCKYHIQRLQDALRVVLRSDQVSSIFYSRFVKYLSDNGLRMSSIKVLCNAIKTCLDWASKYQARVHPSYGDIDIPRYRRTQISLTADEISMIYHYDLSVLKYRPQHIRTLEQTRDMFVLSCNLGQRYSDMSRICKENFREGMFSIIQQKTKAKAVVCIKDFALDRKTVYAILEKYNYNPPYTADKSNYNKQLHELMHIVFKEEMVQPSIICGNLSTLENVPKYKMIASHTARRSFATHNYLVRNYSARQVMKCTGHADEHTFQRYICGDDD